MKNQEEAQKKEEVQQDQVQPNQEPQKEKLIDPYLMVKDNGIATPVIHLNYLINRLAQMIELQPQTFSEKNDPEWFSKEMAKQFDLLSDEVVEKFNAMNK